jgi:hypothetical protein
MLAINCHWILRARYACPYSPHIIVLRKVYTLAYSVNPVIWNNARLWERVYRENVHKAPLRG